MKKNNVLQSAHAPNANIRDYLIGVFEDLAKSDTARVSENIVLVRWSLGEALNRPLVCPVGHELSLLIEAIETIAVNCETISDLDATRVGRYARECIKHYQTDAKAFGLLPAYLLIRDAWPFVFDAMAVYTVLAEMCKVQQFSSSSAQWNTLHVALTEARKAWQRGEA